MIALVEAFSANCPAYMIIRMIVYIHRQCSVQQIDLFLAAGFFDAGQDMGVEGIGLRSHTWLGFDD